MKRRDSLKGIAGLFGLLVSKPEPEAPPADPTPYRVAEAARRLREAELVSARVTAATNGLNTSSTTFLPLSMHRGRS